MHILVTGGAGFIGSNFIRFVQQVDPTVSIRVIDDLSTGFRENLAGLDVDFTLGSVADRSTMMSAAEGMDAIVHLGALGSVPRSINDPLSTHTANLSGTLNVLEAARMNGSYVVFASSSSVYGANTKLPKSEYDWTRPMSPYAVSKLGSEAYVIAYQFSYGMDTLAFRFFNVYGPHQAANHAYAAVIPRFLDAALSGKTLQIHGDGRQSRDFTYVDTVCAALYGAVSRRVSSSDPVNLAYGTNTSLLELIAKLQDALGMELDCEHVAARQGDVRASQSDGVRIRSLFPEVAPTSLDDGLERTVQWYRRQYVNA